jgi:hypothetical protein
MAIGAPVKAGASPRAGAARRGGRSGVLGLCVLLLLAGCGGGPSQGDRTEVLSTVRAAVRALAAGRAAEACGYLTPHGRSRALGYRVDFDREGTIPPSSPRLPQTCEQIVERERRVALDPRLDFNWLDAAGRARFELTDATRETAVVRISGGPLATTVSLRKTDAGWRIDDSPAVPSGH